MCSHVHCFGPKESRLTRSIRVAFFGISLLLPAPVAFSQAALSLPYAATGGLQVTPWSLPAPEVAGQGPSHAPRWTPSPAAIPSHPSHADIAPPPIALANPAQLPPGALHTPTGFAGAPPPAHAPHPVQPAEFSSRTVVPFVTREAPGTIIVDTRSRFLYFVLAGGKAIRYRVGVQRDGFQWFGSSTVSRKAKWPSWTPTRQLLNRRPDISSATVPGGPDNPMGARAIYIGETAYRIHGTRESASLGMPISSGCFRLSNVDVTDLFERVRIGARIIVT